VTIWNVDIMWAMMLFGITLFLGCFIVSNRAMRGMRILGLVTSYAIGVWMFIVLPWRIAATTWCVIAAACGFVVFAYELWARHRYSGTGRRPRPLVLLQGFLLFPAMLPDAMESMVVDAGILPPSGSAEDAS
jgi:hypothetical protein